MRDPIVTATSNGVDSPARDSLKNTETCYSRSLFKSGSFSKSRINFQTSADKFSRTLRCVRNTFGYISQRLKLGGRRRHRLTETNSPCCTPSTPANKKLTKQVLGRSPARLYSPFGIETPQCNDYRMSPYMPDTPEHGISPKRRMPRTWQLLSKKRPRALFN